MSEEPISIRCSALPRIMRCPASAAPSNVVSYSPEAAMGTLVHEAMSKPGEIGNIVTRAENAGLDGAEARFLIGAALDAERKLIVAAGLEDVRREEPLEAVFGRVTLTGSPDVWGRLPVARALVVDYKTGRVDRNHDQQLWGYAFLVLANTPDVDEVVCQTAWLRMGNVDTFIVTRADAAKWWADLLARLDAGGYTDDIEACGFCPHRFECGQYARMLNAATAMIAKPGASLPSTPADRAKLYPAYQQAVKLLEAYKATVRDDVTREGPQDIGDGRELALEPRKRANIDTARAASIIHAHLDADLFTVLEVKKSALEDALREQAPKGMKKKAVEDCMTALEAAGALTWTATEALAMRKKKEA